MCTAFTNQLIVKVIVNIHFFYLYLNLAYIFLSCVYSCENIAGYKESMS